MSQQRAARDAAARAEAMENPLVRAVFDAFPGARITAIETPPEPVEITAGEETSPHETADGVLAEAEEWDPFEDDEG